jgi:hypothetical protein
LATAEIPITAPAPGRFSITIDAPTRSASFAPMMRASTSLPPPGGNGEIILIGRLG